MKNLSQLLQEIKVQKLKKLDEEYAVKKNKILDLTYKNIGELLFYNDYLLQDYPELSKDYIMYEIDYRNSYDERNFHKNNKEITFDEFKNALQSNILDLTKHYSSYEDEITFKIGDDTYSVWWYSGD